MILGLVPARGGSKGIKDKNIRLFCGKPLLVYSIEIGLKCDFIDKLCISSDSKKIMGIALEYGAEIIPRPKKLAQDNSPMMPVLKHAVETILATRGLRVDAVVLLDPTNPLRTVEDVENAYKLFKKDNCNAVVSGVNIPSFNIVDNDDDNEFVWQSFSRDQVIGCRQHCFESVHNLDTTVWIYSREAIMVGRRIPERTKLYLVPEERSCHIDTELDWEVAEHLYGKNLL